MFNLKEIVRGTLFTWKKKANGQEYLVEAAENCGEMFVWAYWITFPDDDKRTQQLMFSVNNIAQIVGQV
jgi:hypothetical protein